MSKICHLLKLIIAFISQQSCSMIGKKKKKLTFLEYLDFLKTNSGSKLKTGFEMNLYVGMSSVGGGICQKHIDLIIKRMTYFFSSILQAIFSHYTPQKLTLCYIIGLFVKISFLAFTISGDMKLWTFQLLLYFCSQDFNHVYSWRVLRIRHFFFFRLNPSRHLLKMLV